jgi:Fur family transcriptional regulator, zinc uptake regulator
MNEQQTSWWQKAGKHCDALGVRLTAKRKQLLQVLLDADHPLSAYDLVAAYAERYGATLKPMSVYRMLDALVGADLVHRLASTNSFMICSGASHAKGGAVQFLICDHCAKVAEMPIEKALARGMDASAKRAGFALLTHQVELHGLCETCVSDGRDL